MIIFSINRRIHSGVDLRVKRYYLQVQRANNQEVSGKAAGGGNRYPPGNGGGNGYPARRYCRQQRRAGKYERVGAVGRKNHSSPVSQTMAPESWR